MSVTESETGRERKPEETRMKTPARYGVSKSKNANALQAYEIIDRKTRTWVASAATLTLANRIAIHLNDDDRSGR